MIRLVFLGRLADLAGAGERDIPADAPVSLETLIAKLGNPLASALATAKVKFALNGQISPRYGLIVQPGDELALLPPVSGG